MSNSFAPLQRFIDFYQQPITAASLVALVDIYHADIRFVDPAHRIEGFSPFERYFNNMLSTVSHCQFVVHSCATDLAAEPPSALLDWTMTLGHPRLNGGRQFELAGASKLVFSGTSNEAKITYHQDYFDLGAMLYERLPLLGAVVRRIRGRLGQS